VDYTGERAAGTGLLVRVARVVRLACSTSGNHRLKEPASSSAFRAWSHDKSVGEVRVDGESFTDAELLPDDEAQTVHGAVRLILVPLEVVEGGSIFVGSGPVYARQLFA
jgi:hypothetical protein